MNLPRTSLEINRLLFLKRRTDTLSASGSKVDIATGNKVAERIGAIVNKHRENARILHNDYGYESPTNQS
jgi:hypothetical protein